ncbi:MAG: CarD family transcriptional regulator [Oscillospiraceae bacterium]|nr:CarD family transcriptional regulator [Oscillospiraceae bacterium]
MYNIGDTIVHPMHGAGIIENITSRIIDGKEIEYYTLKLPTNNMTVMIPVASSGNIGIRDVISAERADELLSLVPSIEIDTVSNWNRRYRENAARIKTGVLEDVIAVIKSLALRDLRTGISTGERKMLHSARQILLSELAVAKGISYTSLEEIFDKILLESLKV